MKEFTTLNSAKEFSKIYKKNTYCWHSKEFVLFYKKSSQKKVAFVASKKVGKAVQRNKAKRLLRAHFIKIMHNNIAPGIYILVAKEPILSSNFQKLSKHFFYIFKKLNLILEKKDNFKE